MKTYDRVPDKETKYNGCIIKEFKNVTEDKGDMEHVISVINEEDNREIATFIKKDGEVVEMSASTDAQESGLLEKIAKKFKVKKEEIKFTQSSMATVEGVLESDQPKDGGNDTKAEKVELLQKSQERFDSLVKSLFPEPKMVTPITEAQTKEELFWDIKCKVECLDKMKELRWLIEDELPEVKKIFEKEFGKCKTEIKSLKKKYDSAKLTKSDECMSDECMSDECMPKAARKTKESIFCDIKWKTEDLKKINSLKWVVDEEVPEVKDLFEKKFNSLKKAILKLKKDYSNCKLEKSLAERVKDALKKSGPQPSYAPKKIRPKRPTIRPLSIIRSQRAAQAQQSKVSIGGLNKGVDLDELRQQYRKVGENPDSKKNLTSKIANYRSKIKPKPEATASDMKQKYGDQPQKPLEQKVKERYGLDKAGKLDYSQMKPESDKTKEPAKTLDYGKMGVEGQEKPAWKKQLEGRTKEQAVKFHSRMSEARRKASTADKPAIDTKDHKQKFDLARSQSLVKACKKSLALKKGTMVGNPTTVAGVNAAPVTPPDPMVMSDGQKVVDMKKYKQNQKIKAAAAKRKAQKKRQGFLKDKYNEGMLTQEEYGKELALNKANPPKPYMAGDKAVKPSAKGVVTRPKAQDSFKAPNIEKKSTGIKPELPAQAQKPDAKMGTTPKVPKVTNPLAKTAAGYHMGGGSGATGTAALAKGRFLKHPFPTHHLRIGNKDAHQMSSNENADHATMYAAASEKMRQPNLRNEMMQMAKYHQAHIGGTYKINMDKSQDMGKCGAMLKAIRSSLQKARGNIPESCDSCETQGLEGKPQFKAENELGTWWDCPTCNTTGIAREQAVQGKPLPSFDPGSVDPMEALTRDPYSSPVDLDTRVRETEAIAGETYGQRSKRLANTGGIARAIRMALGVAKSDNMNKCGPVDLKKAVQASLQKKYKVYMD